MKSTSTLVGILLIIVGVVTLAYQGFTYTQREQIVKIGDIQLTADTQKTIYFPPWLGGLSLVAGVVLVVSGRTKSK
jgi:uncharacterized membrane protein